jgi:hypothetical protein
VIHQVGSVCHGRAVRRCAALGILAGRDALAPYARIWRGEDALSVAFGQDGRLLGRGNSCDLGVPARSKSRGGHEERRSARIAGLYRLWVGLKTPCSI